MAKKKTVRTELTDNLTTTKGSDGPEVVVSGMSEEALLAAMYRFVRQEVEAELLRNPEAEKPVRSKQTMQLAAAVARESKKKLPKDHFKKKAAQRKKQMGPISRLETYPKETLMKLAGWGNAAWGRAVRSGLEVARPGNQVHVTGEAYFRWIDKQSRAETDDSSTDSGTTPSG